MPPARKREPVVAQKVKDAFEYILATPGVTLQSAAAHVGMVPRMLRFKMQRPEALRWMLARKQQELEVVSAGNIPALLAVRDRPEGNEMAKVHASKALEAMLVDTSERTGVGRQVQAVRQPGLQIVVVQTDGSQRVAFQPPAPLIDVTPAHEVAPVSDDGGT
jgi:hypothetical protein